MGASCTLGTGACQATGAVVCDGPTATTCDAVEGAPSAESCDGVDNDCDGVADEDAEGNYLTESCYTGPEGTADVGECHSGVRTCWAGQFGSCDAQGLPEGESCDGLDNDCDGVADEDSLGRPLVQLCYDGAEGTEGVGACHAGVQMCNDGVFAGCVNQTLPTSEVCDARDNDCDGDTDEDEQGATMARHCYNGPDGTEGVGQCVGGGQLCVAGQYEQTCTGELLPSAEACDGADNDCDGDTDEDTNGDPLARFCYSGPEGTEGVGVCVGGVQECGGGAWGECADEMVPSDEVCDSADNDCDGIEDEDLPDCIPTCSNGSREDCNPDGSTTEGSAFVDPAPPENWVQCAGFRNTPGDDVEWNWEQNCWGQRSKIRFRGWDDVSGELLWDAVLDNISEAVYEPLFSSATNVAGSMGMHACDGELDVPKAGCGVTFWRTPIDTNRCSCGDVNCSDIASANAANNRALFVGARTNTDENEIFIRNGRNNSCLLSGPIQRNIRIAVYEFRLDDPEL